MSDPCSSSARSTRRRPPAWASFESSSTTAYTATHEETGAAEEAPWVDGWRRAWLELWRRGELPPELHVASTLLLPSQLQAVSHGLARGSLPGGDASAVLAVLAATPPHGRVGRTSGSRRCARSSPACSTSASGASACCCPRARSRGRRALDLSLDSAAELLHAAITAETALRGAALEACEGSLRSSR